MPDRNRFVAVSMFLTTSNCFLLRFHWFHTVATYSRKQRKVHIQKYEKLSASGGLCPRRPDQGLYPCTPLGAKPQGSHRVSRSSLDIWPPTLETVPTPSSTLRWRTLYEKEQREHVVHASWNHTVLLDWLIQFILCIKLYDKRWTIMQAMGRRRIHASISYNAPLKQSQ